MAAAEQKAIQIRRTILPDIYAEPELKPSEFMSKWWGKYKANYTDDRNVNGAVLEDLIAISLVRSGISPIYPQATVTYLPGVKYDCIVYTTEAGPISISAKASLRERW